MQIAGESSIEQTAVSLRSGPPELRESAATVLKQWPSQIDGGPEEGWGNAIGPLFTRVWPRDRVLCEKQLTIHFAELAIASGDAFPESLMLLLPYLSRLDGYVSIHTIDKSNIPEKFPRETLILLWRLFGPGCTGDFHGVPKILERMIKADKGIELDRRLQWLDQRALRYD